MTKKPDVRWTGNEKIAELMDVSTGACTGCKRPARVPEDVVAVHQIGDVLRPIIVCPDCSPEWERLLNEAIEERMKDGSE